MNGTVADVVAKLCLDKYDCLPKQGKPVDGKWTVLSGTVIHVSSTNTWRVVSLATGTKCLSGDERRGGVTIIKNKLSRINQMKGPKNMKPRSKNKFQNNCDSNNAPGENTTTPANECHVEPSDKLSNSPGALLNDSHAEVLARRGLVWWLVSRLRELAGAGESWVWTRNASGRAELRQGITFHLFSSHPPCGESSHFLFKSNVGSESNLLTREGEIFVTGSNYDAVSGLSGSIRIKPGRGSPTLSLSCSDKILKWNSLGFQGSLLSSVTASPLYFTTVTVGGRLFDADCAHRALVQRNPFSHTNSVTILHSELEFVGAEIEGAVASPDSILWVGGGQANANNTGGEGWREVYVSGRKQGWGSKNWGNPRSWSAVSQRHMAAHFRDVWLRETGVVGGGEEGRGSEQSGIDTYARLKQFGSSYNTKKAEFKQLLGGWSPSKTHLYQFELSF